MLMFALIANLKKLLSLGPRHEGRTALLTAIESFREMAKVNPREPSADEAAEESPFRIPKRIMTASDDLIMDRPQHASSSSFTSEGGAAKGAAEVPNIAAKRKAQIKTGLKKATMKVTKKASNDGTKKPAAKIRKGIDKTQEGRYEGTAPDV